MIVSLRWQMNHALQRLFGNFVRDCTMQRLLDIGDFQCERRGMYLERNAIVTWGETFMRELARSRAAVEVSLRNSTTLNIDVKFAMVDERAIERLELIGRRSSYIRCSVVTGKLPGRPGREGKLRWHSNVAKRSSIFSLARQTSDPVAL